MATLWIDADRFMLERLAGLVDRAHRGAATAALLAETRLLEDRFGLSPLSRQRLRWTIGDAPAEASEPVDGSERWLRAVQD